MLDFERLAYEDMIRDRWFIISDRNQKKFYWDLFVIFLAVYNAIALPMRVAFV